MWVCNNCPVERLRAVNISLVADSSFNVSIFEICIDSDELTVSLLAAFPAEQLFNVTLSAT